MLDTAEFVLKIAFIVLTIIWIGKIMILRTDKQIVINPLLIGISAILVVLPEGNEISTTVTIQEVKVALYAIYCAVVLLGVYSTTRDRNLF
ncbi:MULTISPECIES: hypothetical protein [unclassified Romboutsia]|uniref:hypothetical protein n=1 Tax=unclassified Romboutsia TaxID=2626894 RepID=UPI000821FC69|nr:MULTISPECIES: hypothetical protein [unclassified Romboutsia]SCH65402.1 Uncharacterised protein [uncultured Clostridium sp.]